MDETRKVKALQCSGVNMLEAVDFDMPVIADDCALIKILSCGICGTDLHGIEGKRTVKFPFIPGHEIVATIAGMGRNAADSIRSFGGEISVGDRVTINPRIVCGKCHFCLNYPGRQEMCLNPKTATSFGSAVRPHLFGGWAEYMYLLPGTQIIKLPDSLPDDIAVLVEPFSCAVGCVDRYRTGRERISEDSIVIYGAGAIGMLLAAGFRLAGAKNIVVIDIDGARLDLSKEFGASLTINNRINDSDSIIGTIKDLTDGLGADAVIDACGVPAVIAEGLSLLRRGGRFFEIGSLLNTGPACVDPQLICRNELEILGHYAYPDSDTMLGAANILAEHKMPYEKLVRFFDFDDYKSVIFGKNTGGAVKPAFRML